MSENFTSITPNLPTNSNTSPTKVLVRSQNSAISVDNVNPTIINKVSNALQNAKKNVVNVGRRETHINRSDSFISKTIRFAKADEYIYVSTNWDRFLIFNTIVTTILALILFIWSMTYKLEITQKYVYNDLTKDNADLHYLNVINTAFTYVRVGLGFAAFIASIAQLYNLYKVNSFRNKITPSS